MYCLQGFCVLYEENENEIKKGIVERGEIKYNSYHR